MAKASNTQRNEKLEHAPTSALSVDASRTSFNFTDELIQQVSEAARNGTLQMPADNRKWYRDKGHKNHHVMVTPASSSFYVFSHKGGRRRRFRIGSVSELTVEESRGLVPHVRREGQKKVSRPPSIAAGLKAVKEELSKQVAQTRKVLNGLKADALERIERQERTATKRLREARAEVHQIFKAAFIEVGIAQPKPDEELPPPSKFCRVDLFPDVAMSGIYFVIRSGELVYIGLSKHVTKRWRHHHVIEAGDLLGVVPFPVDELADAEAFYILKYRPTLNKETAIYKKRGGTQASVAFIHQQEGGSVDQMKAAAKAATEGGAL